MELDEMLFSVLVINGSFATLDQCQEDSLQYDGLTWAEAQELVRLSFVQGYEAVIWRLEDE